MKDLVLFLSLVFERTKKRVFQNPDPGRYDLSIIYPYVSILLSLSPNLTAWNGFAAQSLPRSQPGIIKAASPPANDEKHLRQAAAPRRGAAPLSGLGPDPDPGHGPDPDPGPCSGTLILGSTVIIKK